MFRPSLHACVGGYSFIRHRVNVLVHGGNSTLPGRKDWQEQFGIEPDLSGCVDLPSIPVLVAGVPLASLPSVHTHVANAADGEHHSRAHDAMQ
jgi:hypothetical protein